MIIPIFIRETKTGGLSQAYMMKKTLLVSLFLCFTVFLCEAQKPLTNSRQSSYYTYIYKLKPEDVIHLYKYPDKGLDDKILHNPVDSFKTDRDVLWDNNLPAGNYLKVYAEKNKLIYKLFENHSAFLKLMPNDYDLRFILLNKRGDIIPGANVRVNHRPVVFDVKSGLYCTRYSKKDTLLEADYNGVANFFYIKQNSYYYKNSWLKTIWQSLKGKDKYKNKYSYHRSFESHYTGFMVFNKP
jgi:hypothetical protein